MCSFPAGPQWCRLHGQWPPETAVWSKAHMLPSATRCSWCWASQLQAFRRYIHTHMNDWYLHTRVWITFANSHSFSDSSAKRKDCTTSQLFVDSSICFSKIHTIPSCKAAPPDEKCRRIMTPSSRLISRTSWSAGFARTASLLQSMKQHTDSYEKPRENLCCVETAQPCPFVMWL